MTTIRDKTTDRPIPASQFKARCMTLRGEVASTGEQLVINKRCRPIACLWGACPVPGPG